MLEEYLFLEKNRRGKEFEPTPRHVMFAENPEESLRLVTETSNKLKEKYQGNSTFSDRLSSEINKIINPGEIENIIRGNFNLINTLIEKSEKGNPIDTLVFLDKSARNGEYLFYQTCQELLKRNEISESVIPKNIRFIGIDSVDSVDITLNRGLVKLLQEKFRKEDFVGRQILVVDEYIYSGNTLKTAMKVVEEMYGNKPMGIQLYQECPSWYGATSGILGVIEISDVLRNENCISMNALRELDKKTVINLNKLVSHLGPEVSTSLFNRLRLIKGQTLGSNRELQEIKNTLEVLHIPNLSPEELKLIRRLPREIDGNYLWNYFYDAGGYISRRIEDKDKRNNFGLFRKILKDIVSVSMYQRDLLKD